MALSTLIEKPYDFTKKQKSDFTKSTPHKEQMALSTLIDNPYDFTKKQKSDFTKSKPHKEPPLVCFEFSRKHIA